MCEHRSPGIADVVREFYINMVKRRGKKVFVRGKWISYDRENINKAFNLKEAGDGHNFKNLKKELEYQKIVDLLTGGKGKWISSSRDQHKEIFRGSLIEKAKVWFYFLASNLIPGKNLSTVRRNEAIVLYAILKDYKINVGKIIENSILEYYNSKFKGLMLHLETITKLCILGDISYL